MKAKNVVRIFEAFEDDTEDDVNRYFWQGLPKDIRRSIQHDLNMHSKADFSSMKQATRSACHIIQAMIDEEYDEQPFSFAMVMESVSSSGELEELVIIPVNKELVLEKEDLASDDIVLAAGDVVLAVVDEVVWAAEGVPHCTSGRWILASCR
jgi:hypothetical protein